MALVAGAGRRCTYTVLLSLSISLTRLFTHLSTRRCTLPALPCLTSQGRASRGDFPRCVKHDVRSFHPGQLPAP